MKAIKYRLLVDNDLVHVWSGRQIDEIYIPDANLVFNSAGGCFKSGNSRNPSSSGTSPEETVDVADADVAELVRGMEEREKHLAVMSRHFAVMDVR